MKTYPKYKPTNIDWIGEIPENWKNVRLKHITSLITDGSHFSPETEDNGKYYVTVSNVTKSNSIDFENCKKISNESFNNLVKNGCQPQIGDILLTKDGTIGRGTIVVEFNEFVILSSLGLIRVKKNVLNSYVLHYLLSGINIDQMYSHIRGSGITRLTISLISDLVIVLPPLTEQQAIVTYLDQKTTLIDELIAKKERKIELLKENRTALINHAVTKGLNPTVKYKDSGIEWIGEIPEHWSLVKVGHLTRIIRGASPRPAGDPLLFDGDFINWVTVGSVTNSVGKYVWETETFLTEAGMIQSRVVEPETLLISNSGATLGVPKILKIKGCINDGSVAFLDLKSNLERDFLYYFLVSQTDLLREQQSGYGQPNLNTDIIANIRFPLPTIMEQKEVVEFLDSNLEIYDQNINLELQKIEKLREYRQSLISNVVTGKICVLED